MEQRSGIGFGIAPPARPDELTFVDVERLSRYDFLLSTIPAILVVAWLFGMAANVPTWVALAVGTLFVGPLVVDALAVNPPT